MHKQGLSSLTYYVGLHLKEELLTYDRDGTVFGSINQKQMKGLKLNATNSDAAAAFDELIQPMDALIRSRTAESRTLATTRDLLLPKLMSGEIRLRDVEAVA
jgi:type I restriction enzyme S subunit